MPQLIQALKYELFHQSPLSEFLLEKALNNTRVVGHVFFWNLKANLSQVNSRERFYLMLERFLMCCGQFKNELFKQNLVNESLIKLSGFVNNKLDVEKVSKKQTVALMH
jgi:phosphatidylinositol-4,5-bisphosphate 3-kinase